MTDTAPTDPVAARHVSPWTSRQKAARLVWSAVQGTLFRFSFHTMYGWRRMLLRCFGARIAPTAVIRRTARIAVPWNLEAADHASIGDEALIYCLGPIRLGERCSISQRAHLCAGTHDYTRPDLPLLRPPITVEADAWVAADAFVGPGVTVGEGAIVAARAVAVKDVPAWTVVGGNPAKAIKPRPRLDLERPLSSPS